MIWVHQYRFSPPQQNLFLVGPAHLLTIKNKPCCFYRRSGCCEIILLAIKLSLDAAAPRTPCGTLSKNIQPPVRGDEREKSVMCLTGRNRQNVADQIIQTFFYFLFIWTRFYILNVSFFFCMLPFPSNYIFCFPFVNSSSLYCKIVRIDLWPHLIANAEHLGKPTVSGSVRKE